MEEIDQVKDREKYTKKTGMKWDKKQNKEQSKMINGKGKNTQNSAKKIQPRTSSKSGYTCGT